MKSNVQSTKFSARKTRRSDEGATIERYNCGFINTEFMRPSTLQRRIPKQDDGEGAHA